MPHSILDPKKIGVGRKRQERLQSVFFCHSNASWEHGLFKDEDDPGTLTKRKDTIIPHKQWSRWLILNEMMIG